MNILQFLCAVCLFVFLPACVAYGQPSWYKNHPEDDTYYYGSGFNKESRDKAENDAFSDLIQRIHTNITVEKFRRTRSTGVGEGENIESEFEVTVRIGSEQKSIQGLGIDERDTHKGNYYALARLRRADFHKQINRMWKEIQQRVDFGNLSLEEGDVITALQKYDKAFKGAKNLPVFDDKYAGLKIDIEHKIEDIVNDIKITPHSKDQNGLYGHSLRDSLVVRVLYKSQPLEGFPFSASYTRGTGQLMNRAGEMGSSVHIYTDANGNASFRVNDIQSLSRSNHIRVKADQLPESKAVDLHYASSFPAPHATSSALTILLNGSADEQDFIEGSELGIEIHMPEKCYLHLFEIHADGDFKYHESSPIQQEDRGTGWRILREEGRWVLKFDPVPVNAAKGPGLETLLAITTEQSWQPDGTTLTPQGLVQQLKEHGTWRVGWVSYYVASKRSP